MLRLRRVFKCIWFWTIPHSGATSCLLYIQHKENHQVLYPWICTILFLQDGTFYPIPLHQHLQTFKKIIFGHMKLQIRFLPKLWFSQSNLNQSSVQKFVRKLNIQMVCRFVLSNLICSCHCQLTWVLVTDDTF